METEPEETKKRADWDPGASAAVMKNFRARLCWCVSSQPLLMVAISFGGAGARRPFAAARCSPGLQ